jgi:L-amino acid N-acyltransferase YncA
MVTQTRNYPKSVSLADGSAVSIRPLEAGDEAALLLFFSRVSDEEKYYLKDDITSPDVIGRWVRERGSGGAHTLVAVAADGRIVGEASLVRRRGAARRHMADARFVVAEDCRHRGLGAALLRELCDIARESGLCGVMMEAVEDRQGDALTVAESLGFTRLGRIFYGAMDEAGELHDIVLLALPISSWRHSQ